MRRNVCTKAAPQYVGAWVVCTLAMLIVSNGSSTQAQRSPTEPEPRDVGWARPTISEPSRPYLSDPSASSGSGSGLDGTTPILHESAKLTASNRVDNWFGHSVSLSGETVVVGAPRDACAAGEDCGAAYVFRRDGAKWTFLQKLTASDADLIDEFGYDVAVAGDIDGVATAPINLSSRDSAA